jgi:glycine/D-amino acid oxidase-like deaminating enzyme
VKHSALEGDVGWFQPAEVLQLLQLAQATGVLEIERAVERVELVFDSGQLIAARTTGAAVRVGEVLVHRGVVIPEAVELALSMQQDQPGERIGQMLISAGAATQEQVSEAMREVVRRVVYGVLLWRDGRFRFVPGEAARPADVHLDLDLDRVILEGLRLADQRRAS